MIINTFTLLDAVNQFWTVCENGDRRSLTSAGLTYYYLCNVWNTCGRPISFRRQNTLFCAELLISKPTLDRHRNILKQAGLIDFFSKGKGDPNITYRILEVKPTFIKEVKKANNITSGVTSDVTSDVHIKQSTELNILLSGEVKNFYYLESQFTNDTGLKMHWQNQGLPAGDFSNGLQNWMILHNGKSYHSLDDARKHFLFWIPNYPRIQQKTEMNGTNPTQRTSPSHKPGKSAGAQKLGDELKTEFGV